MIRVLIVDDNAFVQAALASLLGSVQGIEVVGQCADGAQVVSAADETDPDVVLMDIEMPTTSGLDATRQLLTTHPGARVLIITGSTVTVGSQDAAEAGAVGYVPKGGNPQQLIAAIQAAAAGGTAWPPDQLPG